MLRVLPLAALALPLLVTAVGALIARGHSEREAEAELSRAADATAEYARRVFDGLVLRVDRANDLLAGLTDSEVVAREVELHDALRRASSAGLPGGDGLRPPIIFVFDRDARPLVSGGVLPTPRQQSFAEQESNIALRGDRPPAVHVGPVYVGRITGEPFFALARRRERTGNRPLPTDGYDGVINASVFVEDASAALRRLGTGGPGDVLTLARTDGVVLARSEGEVTPGMQARIAPLIDNPGRAGEDAAPLPSRVNSVAIISEGAALSEQSTSSRGNTKWIENKVVALRQVSPYPVLAVVERPRSAVLARWRRAVVGQVAVGVPASAALFGLALLVVRSQRRLAEANNELERRVAVRTAELAERDARLTLAVSAAALGVLEWDVRDGTLRADAGVEAITRGALPAGRRLRVDGPERASWREGIHPEDLPRREALRAAMLRGDGDAPADEYRVRMPGMADWTWIATRSVVLSRDLETGLPIRVLDVLRDVSERRRSEDALRESERRLRLALTTASLGVVEWDLKRGVMQVDAGVQAITRGLLPAGRPLSILGPERTAWVARIHPDDQRRREAQVEAMINGSMDAIRGDYRVQLPRPASADAGLGLPNGECSALEDEWVWITYRGGVVARDPSTAQVVRMIDVIQDVTDRKRTEQALAHGEARLRLTTELAQVGIWEFDVTNGRGRWSAEAMALLGVPDDSFTAENWVEMAHPDDRLRIGEAWRRAVESDTPYEVEFRSARPAADGGTRWLLSRGGVERGKGGEPLWGRGVLLDVSERKAAEERQQLLARELDHRAKNALAVVSAAVRLTPRDDPDAFARAVDGRVRALARAHSLLADGRWLGADLRSIAEGELGVFLMTVDPISSGDRPRAMLQGPRVTLRAEAVQALSMALHELATNGTKHGALSVPNGLVCLSWDIDPDAGTLRLKWTEQGGPRVSAPPTRRGFGSRVLDATIQNQLRGQVHHDWRSEGLICEIKVPLSRALERSADDDGARP